MTPPRDQGMIPLREFEVEDQARQEAEAAEAAANAADDILPTLTKDRLRAFKAQARKQIEERLLARRKQRRLLRGGES